MSLQNDDFVCYVSVYYQDGIDWEKDDAIDTLAQECGGREVGAGTMVGSGERDVQCEFKNESDAARFQQRAEQQLKWASSITDIEHY